MDPITVQIVDPQSSGIISKEMVTAGAALAGVAIGGLIGWVSNWWTNRKADQRQKRQHKHDVEVLEKQLAARREELEREARRAETDRSARLKLEKIERAFKLLSEMFDLGASIKIDRNVSKDEYMREIQSIEKKSYPAMAELSLLTMLYFNEIITEIEQATDDLYGICVELRNEFDNYKHYDQESQQNDIKSNKAKRKFTDSISSAQGKLANIIDNNRLINLNIERSSELAILDAEQGGQTRLKIK